MLSFTKRPYASTTTHSSCFEHDLIANLASLTGLYLKVLFDYIKLSHDKVSLSSLLNVTKGRGFCHTLACLASCTTNNDPFLPWTRTNPATVSVPTQQPDFTGRSRSA